MYRFYRIIILFLVVGILFSLNCLLVSRAEVRYQLISPSSNEDIPLTGVNQKRESDSLMLYTNEYGSSTRTNPYGVEVSAMPLVGVASLPGTQLYFVDQITSVFNCEAGEDFSKCGNMAIPPGGGIVLSAAGDKREILLKNFQPGTRFQLNKFLIYESRSSIDSTNPSPETNPRGAGFPGYRGGNQLIVYNHLYGQSTTGTNEFGFEVTVSNNRVVEHEGADSLIPSDENTFILSGHGKARQWLLQNAPIGSRIEIQDSTVISAVDQDSYLYQLDRLVNRIERLKKQSFSQDIQRRINLLKWNFHNLPNEEVASEALKLKEELTPLLWSSYPTVSEATPRAIWHRPSEASLKEIRQSLDLLKRAGFNTIYLETYLHGAPIFPSKTFEYYRIPQKLPFRLKETDDLLKTWLDEAHLRGIKVHVWFQTFYAGNNQYEKAPGSILSTYPEWANIQRSALDKAQLPPSTLEAGSYFIDPANQEAQLFLLDLVDEIVSNYPVDGIQLDYIRYPSSFPPDRYSYLATTWGYTPVARSIFKTRSGIDPVELIPSEQPELWAEWNEFKTRQVDRFVQKTSEFVKMKRPDLILSVAVFPKPEESLVRKHQNWTVWAQNGWVDFIAPMTLTSSLESILTGTKEVKEMTSLPVITGVFGPFNGDTPTEIVEQVWTAISAGATGIALFDTAHLTEKMAEALQMGIFKERELLNRKP